MRQVAKVLELQLENVYKIQKPRLTKAVSVLPMNIQGGFPVGLIGLIFLLSKVLSRVLLQHHILPVSLMVKLFGPYMTTEKTIALNI